MEDTAIRVSGLSKKYTIGKQATNLNLSERLKHFFSKQKSAPPEEDFYALKDITFDIKKGDTVGIIGRNGAGKSTLLKILSEVTEPTEGKIEIRGKIASVLEVGMGFHPELTGRENVYLSGTMLGLQKKTLDSTFDEIVEFSGVGKFIDTPVKHYSSGMYVRLAFSVVTHIDADILIFDEVISLGDAQFQLKILKKIQQLKSQNKTIILVSHNINEIIRYCNTIILLDNGLIRSIGEDITVIKDYIESAFLNYQENNDIFTAGRTISNSQKTLNVNHELHSHDLIDLYKVQIRAEGRALNEDILVDDQVVLEIFLHKKSAEGYVDAGFVLNHFNNLVMAASTDNNSNSRYSIKNTGSYKITASIPKNVLNSTVFNIDLYVSISEKQYEKEKKVIFSIPNALTFKIDQKPEFAEARTPFHGPIRYQLKWESEYNNA